MTMAASTTQLQTRPTGGRPSYLTPEVQAKICSVVREGNYLTVAAACAGIGESTLSAWVNDGNKGVEPYASFVAAVKTARLEAQARLISELKELGTKRNSWESRAWILERTDPDHYGQRQRLDIQLQAQDRAKEFYSISHSPTPQQVVEGQVREIPETTTSSSNEQFT